MKKAITAEQITGWFTIGTQFAQINITEASKKEPNSESSSADPASEKNALVCSDLDGHAGGAGRPSRPPPLPQGRYEYPSLPVTKSRQALISMIEFNSVVIVRGATGSGKTTLLPQFILDHYAETNTFCNVVVTQPRKIGASSIARWVAKERKCTLGSWVGYQVGLEKVATEHTRLIYMTTGILLQKLVVAKSLSEFTHIFIDEVHERTEDLDLLLLLVKMLLHQNSSMVKVILMSATISCHEFAEYFGSPVQGEMIPAFVFEVEGAMYTVDEYYLDDLQSLGPYWIEEQNPDSPSIPENMYNLAVSLIQSFDEMDAKEHSSREEGEKASTLPEKGSVLVFLPGLMEIHNMQDALTRLTLRRLQVYLLHSTVTLDEQIGVFLVPTPGYRKVILSTNIAESSVTVPDVKYVIDFCLARQLMCDVETNYQSLCLTWASKTNCNQRRGRAGRVSKGHCYRLVTKRFWENDIPDHVVPEMQRSSLSTTILKVKLLNMGDPRYVLSKALSPPNLFKIERTVLQLKELGALSPKQDRKNECTFDGELTFLGRVLAQLPVDLYLGKLIVLGHAFGCLEESLIIAASLSLKSFFAMPFVQRMAGYQSKLSFSDGVSSDCLVYLNAFKAWQKQRSEGKLKKEELEWGKENCIQIKRIREVADVFEDLKNRVAQFHMHINEREETTDYESFHKHRFILQVVIAGAFYPKYFTVGNIDEELANKELLGKNPKNTVMVRNIPAYGFLYNKQLQSLFRQCGQVKSISFDASRAFVEFHNNSSCKSGVLPEVSLALYMAHQHIPMTLFVHPVEEVEARANGRIMSPLRHGRVNVDFQNQTVEPVRILTSSVDFDQLPPSLTFILSITQVVEVGHFWGFLADEKSLEKQHRLTAEINSGELHPLSVSIVPNLMCLAPYAEDVGASQYYRAKVLQVCGSEVEVVFLDYGNVSRVSTGSLKVLSASLLECPFLAKEFQISGMRPSARSVILGKQWSYAARNRFITLVTGRSHIASLFSIQHEVMYIDLLINKDSKNSSVVDIMVEEGHARRVEESLQSKQTHEIYKSIYLSAKDGKLPSSSPNRIWVQKKVEEKELIDSLLATFGRSGQPSPKCKVTVHGPSSPYKTSFNTMSSVMQHRLVVIEKESINSVALNETPEEHHERLLVAGKVSISSSGSQLLLKETTLMPNIPGLPALLCMLFTPIMELRTDATKTRFTGALCGMGYNEQSQEPVLAEHDIELAFDVKIGVDDIIEVNDIREAINCLVSEGPNGPHYLDSDRVAHLQQDNRDKIISLFTKFAREECAQEYYEKPKRWNQVDPTLNMEQRQKNVKKRRFLFQPHPIIFLNI